MSVAETKKMSFELNEEMLSLIAKEFNAEDVADRFAKEAAEKGAAEAGESVFGAYGRQLAQRSLQLGNEYSDRTYEVMLEMIDHTGGAYKFPLLPQRFLEIAYLSTQELYTFPIRYNSNQELRFEINDCKIFKALEGKCSKEDLKDVPCRAGCMNLIKSIFNGCDLDVAIDPKTDPIGSSKCIFSVTKGL